MLGAPQKGTPKGHPSLLPTPRSSSSGCAGMGCLRLLQRGQDLGGRETREVCEVAPGTQSRVLLGLGASPGPPLSQAGYGGPQTPSSSVGRGSAGCPPSTCPGSNLWLGVPPVPGAPRCPPAPPWDRDKQEALCPRRGQGPARNVPVATGLFVWSQSSWFLPGGARINTAGNSP